MLISAIEETLARGKSPTGTDGPATIMNSLRTVSINGLTGPLKIAERSNNAYSRTFSFESFRAYDERMEYRGVIAANRADVRVCGGGGSAQASKIGPICAASAEPVDSVVAYAQSDRALHITWHWKNERAHHRSSNTNHADANTANATEDAVEEEQLLSGYRIIVAAAGTVDVDVRVPRTQNNATFGVGDIKANVVYTVIVRALYDDGAIQAAQVLCNSPGSCSGSLPCLPSKTKVPTCDCSTGMLHTMGLERKPQLIGCRRCVPGLVCRGGGVSSTFTAPGWFAVNVRKLTLVTEDNAAGGIAANKDTDTDDTPLTQASTSASTRGTTGSTGTTVAEKSSMFRCPNKDACLGGWSVAQLKVNAQNASFHALYSQCADGYTGILCTACIEGYARGGDSACSKCTVSRSDALLIILCSVFVIITVVASAIVATKRAGRAPLLERAFLRVMTNATKRRGVEGAINLFFSSDTGEEDSTTRGGEGEEGGDGGDGGGLSYDRFVEALRPGGSLALSVPSAIIDNEARSLWVKLDEDGDGAITSDELLAFFFEVKSGHKSANPVRVQVRMNE